MKLAGRCFLAIFCHFLINGCIMAYRQTVTHIKPQTISTSYVEYGSQRCCPLKRYGCKPCFPLKRMYCILDSILISVSFEKSFEIQYHYQVSELLFDLFDNKLIVLFNCRELTTYPLMLYFPRSFPDTIT